MNRNVVAGRWGSLTAVLHEQMEEVLDLRSRLTRRGLQTTHRCLG